MKRSSIWAVRTEVVSGEVNEGSSDLRRGESEELTGRGGLDLSKRAVQPQGGSLKHVISLLPAFQMRIVMQHLSRQAKQTVGRSGDQLTVSGFVAGCRSIEERLELCGVSVMFGHGQPNARSGPRFGNEYAMVSTSGHFSKPTARRSEQISESWRLRLTRNSEKNLPSSEQPFWV